MREERLEKGKRSRMTVRCKEWMEGEGYTFLKLGIQGTKDRERGDGETATLFWTS